MCCDRSKVERAGRERACPSARLRPLRATRMRQSRLTLCPCPPLHPASGPPAPREPCPPLPARAVSLRSRWPRPGRQSSLRGRSALCRARRGAPRAAAPMGLWVGAVLSACTTLPGARGLFQHHHEAGMGSVRRQLPSKSHAREAPRGGAAGTRNPPRSLSRTTSSSRSFASSVRCTAPWTL